MPDKLRLESLTYSDLCKPEIRRKLLEDNKCDMMSQSSDDAEGTVEITVRNRRLADGHEKHKAFQNAEPSWRDLLGALVAKALGRPSYIGFKFVR